MLLKRAVLMSTFARTVQHFRVCSTIINTMENGAPNNKKKTVQIGTHDGIFHCDDALACFMLKRLPEYQDAKIVRTRDMEILNTCDIVVDVGGEYNPSTHRYDHHQRSFSDTISSVKATMKAKYNIKLSSAGLIYAHFGERIINLNKDLSADCIDAVYDKIYEYFIQEIDAIDNGVPICDGEPKYRITTNISSTVGGLNPAWNVKPTKSSDEIFEDAMEMVGNVFMDKINYYLNSWWPAREIVKKAIDERFNVHSSGKIAQLETFAPWKQHYFDLKSELNFEDVAFFLYKDKSWRAIAVPITPDSFICKTFLKEEWRGLRDEELSKISGIPGCVFCHHTGFIGGNETREGILEMAVKSLI